MEKEEIEEIKTWLAGIDPGCDDPEDVAEKGEEYVSMLLSALDEKDKEIERLREVLKEILEALRIHAPGTPLNNHRFDALGIKAYAAIARNAQGKGKEEHGEGR